MVRFYIKDSERKTDPDPVKVNAPRAFAVGTAIWVIALLALLATLKDSEKSWWIFTCIIGIFLGVLGFFFIKRRR